VLLFAYSCSLFCFSTQQILSSARLQANSLFRSFAPDASSAAAQEHISGVGKMLCPKWSIFNSLNLP